MEPVTNPRLERERQTIRAMIHLYCRGNHTRHSDLCPTCSALFAYALKRIAHCPFQSAKPTCANCSIHCYQADRRSEVRQVMRWAGPRMLVRHPILTVLHYWDGWKSRPEAG